MGRMQKVNELIKREIGMIIQQDIQDPRLEFVTIMSVAVSPDLHIARVKYSVLGDENKRADAQKALSKASGYIRNLIGQRVTLRHIPRVEFIFDPSLDYSARIKQTLKEIHDEDANRKTQPNI